MLMHVTIYFHCISLKEYATICFIIGGHLVCFWFGAVTNTATVNIPKHASWCTYAGVSLGI